MLNCGKNDSFYFFSSIIQNSTSNIPYPCLCLCLGFSQRILTTPFLFTILHLEHIGFTEGFTFIIYPPKKILSTMQYKKPHTAYRLLPFVFCLLLTPNTALFKSIRYTAFSKIVRGKLDSNFIPRQYLYKMHTHLT